MSVHDPVSDFLTVLRNAKMAQHDVAKVKVNNHIIDILEVLKKERFINDFKVFKEGPCRKAEVKLRYIDGVSCMSAIERKSKCSRRLYSSAKKMSGVLGGIGISIISTSKGVMTSREAKKKNVGGEIICHVW